MSGKGIKLTSVDHNRIHKTNDHREFKIFRFYVFYR